MKIVHFECGLGNQLACFANYLLVNGFSDDVYIENLVYQIDRKGMGFDQWNGFELENIFGLKFDNILDVVSDKESLIRSMADEYYKNEGQNNSLSALKALKSCGIEVEPAGVFQQESDSDPLPIKIKHALRNRVVYSSNTCLSYKLKKTAFKVLRRTRRYNSPEYYIKDGDYFYPLSFDVMKDIRLLEPVESRLREALRFPAISGEQNIRLSETIDSSESVSIHARRSDFLQYNNDCYKYGYFKRAVEYIRKHVENPAFFIFSDDSRWCKTHLAELGLDKDDKVSIVDWNTGDKSYIDMQLMSMCKHNIITKSSFGWWAAFLNTNPDKIIISQVSEYYSKVYL